MKRNKSSFYRLMIFIVGMGFALGGIQFQLGRPWPLSILSMLLYTISIQPYWKDLFHISEKFGKFVNIPLIYFIILFVSNFLNQSVYETPLMNITLLEDYLFFLLLLVHVYHDVFAMRFFMWGFSVGIIILSVLAMLGVGMEIEIESKRMLLFGQNPNDTSIFMSIGSAFILVDFIFRDKIRFGRFRYLLFLSYIPIVSCILLMGSRTGLLALVTMIIAIILLYPLKSRLGKVFLVATFLTTFAYFAVEFLDSDNLIATRMTNSIEKGDMSGRDGMWESLVPFVLDRPLFGYGETGYVDVSRQAFGEVRVFGGYTYGFSPHNVIFELLIYTGIIGLTLWLIFWWKISLFSWKCYRSRKEFMPIVFLIPIFASILSAQLLTSLWSYFIYAFILAEYRNKQLVRTPIIRN